MYINVYMYILCLIVFERLEVFLNVFAGFVNLGKSEKQRKL